MTRKTEHREALRARAQRAIADMYHNATPTYPRELYGRSDDYFQSWFEDTASFEIEYIQDGGSTPGDYRKCLAAPCNAGRYKSEAARAYYIRKGLRERDIERSDCGALTGWRVLEVAAGGTWMPARAYSHDGGLTRHNALWECISEYGKLYQYGRGGRTLAPEGLIGGGYNAGPRPEYADDLSAAACVELIRIVESFNAYVSAWCADVPEQWREHCEAEDAEALAQKRARAARKAKETRERRHWEARGMLTGAA